MASQAMLSPNAPANNNEVYIPECPLLNNELSHLHIMARDGRLSMESAERQINSYLFAGAYLAGPKPKVVKTLKGWPRSLLTPLGDSPHYGTLPDLGGVIHRVLCRQPQEGDSLWALIEQCIPCYRSAILSTL